MSKDSFKNMIIEAFIYEQNIMYLLIFFKETC